MKAKIQKIHFERAVKKGDNLDKSECERRPMRPPTSPSPPCPLLQGALGLPCQACRGLYSLMMAFVRCISPPSRPLPFLCLRFASPPLLRDCARNLVAAKLISRDM